MESKDLCLEWESEEVDEEQMNLKTYQDSQSSWRQARKRKESEESEERLSSRKGSHDAAGRTITAPESLKNNKSYLH